MRIYDNRLTSAEAFKRLKGRPAIAGVRQELNSRYTAYYLVVRTLALSEEGEPVEAFTVSRSGRVKGGSAYDYMPVDLPPTCITSPETLVCDENRLAARYQSWARARFLEQFGDKQKGERAWQELERRRQALLR